MPLGILVWLILIFLIACAQPGFLPMLFTLLGIAAVAFLLYAFISNRITRHQESEQYITKNREKAIDAWEKKWKRTHPTRINRK